MLSKAAFLFFILASSCFAQDPATLRSVIENSDQPYMSFSVRPAPGKKLDEWTEKHFLDKRYRLEARSTRYERGMLGALFLGRYRHSVSFKKESAPHDPDYPTELSIGDKRNDVMTDIAEMSFANPHFAENWSLRIPYNKTVYKAYVKQWLVYVDQINTFEAHIHNVGAELVVEDTDGKRYLVECPISLSDLANHHCVMEKFERKNLVSEESGFAMPSVKIVYTKSLFLVRIGGVALAPDFYATDEKNLLEMENSTYGFRAWTKADFIQFAEDPSFAVRLSYVEDKEGNLKVAGYYVTRRASDHIELLGMGVKKEYEGLGVERQILNELTTLLTEEQSYVVARLPKFQQGYLEQSQFQRWDDNNRVNEQWKDWHFGNSLINTADMSAISVDRIPANNSSEGLWAWGAVPDQGNGTGGTFGGVGTMVEEGFSQPKKYFKSQTGLNLMDPDSEEEEDSDTPEGILYLKNLNFLLKKAREAERKPLAIQNEVFEISVKRFSREWLENLLAPRRDTQDLQYFMMQLREHAKNTISSPLVYNEVNKAFNAYRKAAYWDKENYADELKDIMELIREILHPFTESLANEKTSRIVRLAEKYLETKQYRKLAEKSNIEILMKHVIGRRKFLNDPITAHDTPVEEGGAKFFRKGTGVLCPLSNRHNEGENLIFSGDISNVWLYYLPKVGPETFAKGTLRIPKGFFTLSKFDTKLHYPVWIPEAMGEMEKESIFSKLWDSVLSPFIKADKDPFFIHQPNTEAATEERHISLSREGFLEDFRRLFAKHFWAIRAYKLETPLELNKSAKKHYQSLSKPMPQKPLFITSWVLADGYHLAGRDLGATELYSILSSEDTYWNGKVVSIDMLQEAELDLKAPASSKGSGLNCSSWLLKTVVESMLEAKKI